MNNTETQNNMELESYNICLAFLVIFAVATTMVSGFLIAFVYAFFM